LIALKWQHESPQLHLAFVVASWVSHFIVSRTVVSQYF